MSGVNDVTPPAPSATSVRCARTVNAELDADAAAAVEKSLRSEIWNSYVRTPPVSDDPLLTESVGRNVETAAPSAGEFGVGAVSLMPLDEDGAVPPPSLLQPGTQAQKVRRTTARP